MITESFYNKGEIMILGKVILSRLKAAASVLSATMIIGVSACVPAPDNSAEMVAAASVVSEPAAPLYISSKHASTDCGVEATPAPFPGFADRPNAKLGRIPPPMIGYLAIGADRPMVETDKDRVSPGYVLIEPAQRMPAYLVNNDKEVVASFENDYFSFTQLLPDGGRFASSSSYDETFAERGGQRGCIEEYGTDGSLTWRVRLASEDYIHHHDAVQLDNGNVLALVWERVSTDFVVALGRNPEHVAEDGEFWFEGVVEVNPITAEIVWEWSSRHHLIQDFDAGKPNYGVVADHPELLDINVIYLNADGSVNSDWIHFNAIDYNAELDQIVMSSPDLNEIYVIDHSVNPYEAQGNVGGRYGKGGDYLYRWGNPQNYGRGTPEDRRLYNQHDVHWIDPGLSGAGNLIIFNNGDGRVRPYSTVIEFTPEMNPDGSYALNEGEAYGLEKMVWEYDPDPETDERFFSFFISSAQRLPNGNTLIAQGAGAKVREVTAQGEIVWEYAYKDETDAPHMLFRAYRFPADHPAVVGILEQNAD